MQIKRWLTGIIFAPLLIYMIGIGPRWLFYSFLFVAAIAGLIEFYRMSFPALSSLVRWSSYFITLLLFLIFRFEKLSLAPVIISLWALVPLTFYMLRQPEIDGSLASDVGTAVFGPVYICLPLAMLIMIDMCPQGNMWIFFLLAVIFANDTAAFYIGSLLGRHKLYEKISPRKTWEGAAGGLIGSLIVALLFLSIIQIHEKNQGIIILVLLLSVVAQIGDLSESLLKRISGIKDSGKILPGHGGILDVIDGLLFAIPVMYLYLYWII